MLAFIAAAGLLAPNPLMESIERPTRTSEALALDSSGRYALRSPSGSLDVQIALPQGRSTKRPSWSLKRGTKTLLDGCLLSLTEKARGDLMEGARVDSVETRFVDERVPILFGKSSEGVNRFREIRLGLRTPDGGSLALVFRCFDDAVAFRYEVESLPGSKGVVVQGEDSSFVPAGEWTAYARYMANFANSREHLIAEVPLSDLRQGVLLDTPLTLQRQDGITLAITEAGLREFPGMSLMRPIGDTRQSLFARLSPRSDGSKAVCSVPFKTPWRVVLIGNRPGDLLESTTLYCLNDPPAIGDASWIRPGKMTWYWWNGYVGYPKTNEPILSFEAQKRYIDFAAANGILYHSIISSENDEPWYINGQPGLFPGAGADSTKVRPDLHLKRIADYARSKGVRLWTWVHQATLRGKDLDAVFAHYRNLGWSGMMVDFFDNDDQATVQFAEEILKAAARHQILIHFHGMYKPTGWERTYPNLMNHEGSLNLEYLKWRDTCTPEHTLRVMFTRQIAGPMDYHLGGFRSVVREDFVPRNVGPNVLGTRGFNLALYVLIDNPNPMVSDYPAAYEGQAGLDFLREVPTYWEETRVLAGKVGEIALMARRKGASWWVGCASAGEARTVRFSASFLGRSNFRMRLWRDADGADLDPNLLTVETREVRRGEEIEVRLARDGGFVAEFRPAK